MTLGGLAVNTDVQKVDTGVLPCYSKYTNTMLYVLLPILSLAGLEVCVPA